MRLFHKLCAGFAVLGLCALALPAQGDVLGRQEKARLRFQELHESMQRLQAVLAQTEPEEGKILAAGNKYVQEAQIREDMAKIREMLSREEWDSALEAMGEVRGELKRLMDLLLDRDHDLRRLMEEIARLEAFKNRVDDLIAKQQSHKEDAARAEALQKHLENIDRAKAELEQVIQEQKDLRAEANDAGLKAEPTKAENMAGKQGDLKKDAEDLAKKLDEIEQTDAELKAEKAAAEKAAAEKAAKAGDPKAGQPKAGDPKAGQPKSKDAKGAPKAGQPKEAKPKAGESKGKAGSKSGSCSGSCQSASKSMGKAQQKLGQNKPENSLEDMNQALRKLEETQKELEDMAEKARRELQQLPFEMQARKQEHTKVDTDKLAKDMEEASKGEDGKAKKQTPGQKNVQQSVPKMKAAAGQLKEYKPSKAKQKQQDAKEDLEKAKKDLEDALAQLRQELQDEVLRALEERFAAMLAKQKELSARTKVTDRLRGEALTADGGLPAALVKRCEELGGGEMDLASEAGDALKLLEEEGTTAVFPELVSELKQDLMRVAGRLNDHKTAQATQRMQAEIEELLGTLINALRKTIEDGESGQCGSCNGQPPLVPLSAELKLIQALQKRVAKRTKSYDSTIPEQLRVTDEAQDEALEISRKQGRVEDLTRKLADKLNKEVTDER